MMIVRDEKDANYGKRKMENEEVRSKVEIKK